MVATRAYQTILVALTLTLTLAWAAPRALAQESQGGYKIGVVDMQRLLKEYDKRKQAYDRLEKEVEDLQSEIDRLSSVIEADKKKYEEDTSLSDDARLDLRNKIESNYAKYRAELESRQRIIDNKEEQVIKEVFQDIVDAVTSVAEQDGFHLVLNAGNPSSPRNSVVYYATPLDITGKVLATLNR